MIGLLLASLAALLVVWSVLSWYNDTFHSTNASRYGVGLPILYNTIGVLRDLPRFYDVAVEHTERSGGVMTFSTPGTPRWILTVLPEDNKFILSDAFDCFPKGSQLRDAAGPLLGRGIFNVDGARWKMQRKTAAHLFKVNELRRMTGVFAEHSEQLVQHLLQREDLTIDAQDVFARFTLDCFVSIAYGVELNCLEKPTQFSTSFNKAQTLVIPRFLFPLHRWLGPLAFLHPIERAMTKHMKVLNGFTQQLLADYRAQPQGDPTSSLLARFVHAATSDPSITDEEIAEILLNFLVAGRDTTAATLAYGTWYLAQNPRVEKEIIKELDEVLGEGVDEVSYEQTKELRYMRAFFDEVLRLCPPVPMDPKQATKDLTLPSGTTVPKGATVVWSAWALGRSKRYWDRPELFFPERFIDPERFNGGKPIDPWVFIPFQKGSRICLGLTMAYTELIQTMGKLLRHVRFEAVDDKFPQYLPSVTLFAKDGVPVIIRRR